MKTPKTKITIKVAPVKPRNEAAWRARQLFKSNQVPNQRAADSRNACRGKGRSRGADD